MARPNSDATCCMSVAVLKDRKPDGVPEQRFAVGKHDPGGLLVRPDAPACATRPHVRFAEPTVVNIECAAT